MGLLRLRILNYSINCILAWVDASRPRSLHRVFNLKPSVDHIEK